MTEWLVKVKPERMWKEAVMGLFLVLSQYLPGGTEENLSQDSSLQAKIWTWDLLNTKGY
jgi:hypothetical protein